MPDLVQVTILIDQDTAARYLYAAERRGRDARRIMADDLHALAQSLDEPPRRRTKAEVREESRERRGGVSAHTEALRVIPPGRPA